MLPHRWPAGTITYYNEAPQYEWSVQQGIAAWNSSGARVKFVRAPRSRAKLIIRFGDLGIEDIAGAAYIYPPRQRRPEWARVLVSDENDRFLAAHVVAHELGHVLGLAHEDRRCAAMNSRTDVDAGGPYRCAAVAIGKWRCRLLERDDIAGVVRQYGGRVRPQPQRTCFKWRVPAAPTAFVAAREGANLRLSLVTPPSEGVKKIVVVRARDVCPAAPEQGAEIATLFSPTNDFLARSATLTALDQTIVAEPPGRYCYVAWAYEEAGRRSAAATLFVDWPGPA